MIEEIIKVELSYQQRLVMLTETLIIPGTTKPNLININCIISKRILTLKADVSVSSWHHSHDDTEMSAFNINIRLLMF